MADRKYDEAEIGQILRVAAERQSGATGSGASEGMTLTELQAVAKDVGIDPRHIGRAASELDASLDQGPQGISKSVFASRLIDGQLSNEGWERVVTELRRFTGKPGKERMNGRAREWIGGSETASVMLSARSGNGRTDIELLGDTSGAKALAWIAGLVFGILIPLMSFALMTKQHLAGGAGQAAGIAAIIAVGCVTIAVGLERAHRQKFRSRVVELLGTITGIVEAAPMLEEVESPLKLGQDAATQQDEVQA